MKKIIFLIICILNFGCANIYTASPLKEGKNIYNYNGNNLLVSNLKNSIVSIGANYYDVDLNENIKMEFFVQSKNDITFSNKNVKFKLDGEYINQLIDIDVKKHLYDEVKKYEKKLSIGLFANNIFEKRHNSYDGSSYKNFIENKYQNIFDEINYAYKKISIFYLKETYLEKNKSYPFIVWSEKLKNKKGKYGVLTFEVNIGEDEHKFDILLQKTN